MASELFKMSAPGLIKLRRFYKAAPRQFTKAAASMLTSFAFGTRAQALKVIKGSMTVRNPRFVAKMMRAEKADGNQPINAQEAIAGSLKGQRFTGWAEQELGKAPRKTRTASLFARTGGQKSKQMKRSARLLAGKKFPTPDDVPGKNAHHRAQVLLIITNREKFKGTFVIKGHDDLLDGLYTWGRGGRLKLLQNFEADNKPKKLPWLTRGKQRYFRKTNIPKLWEKTLKRFFRS